PRTTVLIPTRKVMARDEQRWYRASCERAGRTEHERTPARAGHERLVVRPGGQDQWAHRYGDGGGLACPRCRWVRRRQGQGDEHAERPATRSAELQWGLRWPGRISAAPVAARSGGEHPSPGELPERGRSAATGRRRGTGGHEEQPQSPGHHAAQ